jgi:hypothetical protein
MTLFLRLPCRSKPTINRADGLFTYRLGETVWQLTWRALNREFLVAQSTDRDASRPVLLTRGIPQLSPFYFTKRFSEGGFSEVCQERCAGIQSVASSVSKSRPQQSGSNNAAPSVPSGRQRAACRFWGTPPLRESLVREERVGKRCRSARDSRSRLASWRR